MTRRGERMVRWYNPVQLLRTGIDIFVTELLHAHADTRLLEIQTGPELSFVEGENAAGDDGFWFDHMANTGDGFVTTFTMARLLSREKLVLAHRRKKINKSAMSTEYASPSLCRVDVKR